MLFKTYSNKYVHYLPKIVIELPCKFKQVQFFAQKPKVLAQMLIQGPLGLELHIYQKPDHPR